MYTDVNALSEYAFHGQFYKTASDISSDGNLLEEEIGEDVIVLDTDCDIQKEDLLVSSGAISMGYKIYFPMPINDEGIEAIPDGLTPGIRFRGKMFDMDVNGMVKGVFPTQMHGCLVYIKGSDI